MKNLMIGFGVVVFAVIFLPAYHLIESAMGETLLPLYAFIAFLLVVVERLGNAGHFQR